MNAREAPPFQPRTKRDYVPRILPRALQADGLLRYTPDYPDPSDTKTSYYTQSASTARATVTTPSPGKRIRVVHIRVIHRPANSTPVTVEIYFGTAAEIASSTGPIDAFQLSGATEQTRSWPRGQGPRGGKDEVLSIRQNGTAAGGLIEAVIDYTEER